LVVLETSGIPFFDTEGNFLGYRGIDRDITERKQAEKALKKSEADLRNKKESLEETNIALRVLLRKGEENKAELEEKKKLLFNKM